MNLKRYKKQIIFFAPLLALALVCLFAWLRPPVVIVTDNAFLALYGAKRARNKQLLLTARLWRRVRYAPVADDAVQDAAVFAVGAVSAAPFLAVFPERFSTAAENYAAELKTKGQGKNTRVCIVRSSGGGNIASDVVEIFAVDRKTDVYRAGLCASVIAKDGEISVFSAEVTPDELREAFIAGLQAGSYTKAPSFRRFPDIANYEKSSCIVILSGYNANFFASASPQIPVIMFTWLDPSFTPDAVKIVFDDSPPGVVSQIASGRKTLYSETRLLLSRLEKKSDLKLFMKYLAAARAYDAG